MLRTCKLLLRALKNTLLIEWLVYKNKITYPLTIISSRKFVVSINLDLLLDNQDVYVLRRSDHSPEDTFNDMGYLRADVIKTARMPLLSVNLLGALFKPEYSKYRISNGGDSKWNGECVFISEHLNDYSELPESCNIYLHANLAHGQSYPFAFDTKDPNHRKELDKYLKGMGLPTIKEGGGNDLKGTIKLKHDPRKLNYWHVEYHVYNYDDQEILTAKRALDKNACDRVITNVISVSASRHVKNIPTIPQQYYKIA